MKLMVIDESFSLIENLKEIFSKSPYEYIHYKELKKGLNNLVEVSPDILLFNEDNFLSQGDSVRTLLKSSQIQKQNLIIFFAKSYENKKKDDFYFINSDIKNSGTINFLNKVIAQSNMGSDDTIQFIITHPVSKIFIFGRVESINENCITIIPDFPDSAASIVEGTKIECCTLKTKKNFYTFSSTLFENQTTMKFEIDKKLGKKLLKDL